MSDTVREICESALLDFVNETFVNEVFYLDKASEHAYEYGDKAHQLSNEDLVDLGGNQFGEGMTKSEDHLDLRSYLLSLAGYEICQRVSTYIYDHFTELDIDDGDGVFGKLDDVILVQDDIHFVRNDDDDGYDSFRLVIDGDDRKYYVKVDEEFPWTAMNEMQLSIQENGISSEK